MCFGKKDHYKPEEQPRPAVFPPPQPTYASTPGKPAAAAPPQQQAPVELDAVSPPPGPPPAQDVKAPDGPPPAYKPQHDWETLVPDTALFPPPPNLFSGHDRSYTSNATEAEAEAGEAWVREHPLARPLALDARALDALAHHSPLLFKPPHTYRGELTQTGASTWVGRTEKSSRDSTIICYPPLYSVNEHGPLATGKAKTIYYEVAIAKDGTPAKDICLALGYTALPYPSFRMPGWHRGSLAVHGDDGHKYINDRWGGKDFTKPFARGETYGLGMTLAPPSAAGGPVDVSIFLTREGREIGRWDLHEETDATQDLPVTGLEGLHDLSCAVGTYGAVGFEIIFDPARWKYSGVIE